MADIAPQVFSGITPAQYATLIQKANAAGIAISGNSGTAQQYGVEIAWTYSPQGQTLTFQCLSTPFFIKPADVYARIQAVVTESLA